jgi:hypothetical protein
MLPQHEGAAHFGETKPMVCWQTKPQGKTNLRLQEMAACSVPLFPACYLQ